MNLLYWIPFFWPDPGGIETSATKFLPALVRRGYRVTVVASHGRFECPDVTDFEGIPVHRFHFRAVVGRHDPAGIMTIRRAVAALKRAVQPDLVHVRVSDPSGFFHLATSDAHPSPMLLSVHQNVDFYHLDASEGTLLGKLIGAADWVHTVSAKTHEVLLRAAPSIAGRSSVIRNGVVLPDAEPAPLPFDPPHLVSLGRLIERKGIDVLLASFARLLQRHPNVVLTIAGDGPDRGALERQAEALGLGAAVRFVGWVPRDDVPALLNSATMLVLPSRAEGFPIVALEAAQLARPVVASDVDGIPEVIAHGEAGLLVPCDDVGALTDAIASLLAAPEAARRMGEAARRRVLGEFAMEHVTDQYDALYRTLVRPRAAEAAPC